MEIHVDTAVGMDITHNSIGLPQTKIPASAAPLSAPQSHLVQPEFIRLPKGGLEPYSGLSRSKLNQLVLPCRENGYKAPVRSVCLRKPGAVKGTRLIHLASLLAYLNSQMEGGV